MTQPAHAERAHATWSASSTARNWACSGALALAQEAGPEKENPAAAWGTACHEISDVCLREQKDPSEFAGREIQTKSSKVPADDEMIVTAREYIEYVRAQIGKSPQNKIWIEEQFSLQKIDPPFDAGGTCDAIVYHFHENMLEVIDLKGGRGVVVEATGNSQLRTYALGAMLAHPDLNVATIKVTIVQPRAPHRDGRIRSEVFYTADLVEWTGDLRAAMLVAKRAMEDFKTTPRAAWANAYLAAGDHCKFCRAAGFCPALEKQALDAAGVWFDDVDQPRISNEPQQMDGAKLAHTLDMLEMIEEWIKAVRGYAHAQADSGVEIPGYQLVEKIGNRKWGDEAKAYDTLRELGFTAEQLTTSKMKSPAQVEKLLGKQKNMLADLTAREVTGVNLVKTSKTTRAAAPAKAERFFTAEEG